MKVLGNRLQIRPLPHSGKTDDGLFYLPDQRQPSTQLATVLAVGSGVTESICVGDTVLLDQYRLNDKTDSGHGTFIIATDAVSLIIPRVPAVPIGYC